MRLPSVDLEMMYWRARRRTQRLRAACRDHVSHIRAEINLRSMYRRARRPAQSAPEDAFVYRGLWAVVVAGVILLITIESLGQDEFERRVDAVLAAIGAPHRPTATPDIVAALKQPNSK
jgi:hypothetical protein